MAALQMQDFTGSPSNRYHQKWFTEIRGKTGINQHLYNVYISNYT